MLCYIVLLVICFVRGAEVFDVQEVWPLVRPEARSSSLGNANWIEFGISISTSLASCGLLAEATFLGSQCAHLGDCSNLDPVIDFMKYAVAAWIGGKMVQCVMGCVTVSEPRIIRPILMMISTLFLWAVSMIIATQVQVPIAAGFSFLWLGLVALEVSDLVIILTRNNCCQVSYEPMHF